VVGALRQMAQALKLEGAQPFRVQAYEQAATRLAALSDAQLVERSRSGTLTRLPGIGPKMAAHVAELLESGALSGLKALEKKHPPEARALLQLPGVGPRRAAALWEGLQTSDPAALLEAARSGRVRGLDGFGPSSELALAEALERLIHEGAGARVGLAAARPIAERLLRHLAEGPGVVQLEVAGEVRRWCETLEQVELVVATTEPEAFVTHLLEAEDVVTLAQRTPTYVRVSLLPPGLHATVHLVSAETFAGALVHHTGSPAHLEALARLAKARGLTLTEDGLLDAGGTRLKFGEEAALYARLGLPLLPPEVREGTGEIEAALEGTFPEDLISHQDIRGVVHSHSTWSDGKASLRQMAIAARARGMRYLTVTDHSQTASYAGGLTPERLRQQWKEIDALNRELGDFRLLKGIESDILREGQLDLPADMLRQLEVVIASIHSRHGMDGPPMTQRILRALDQPHTQILGHPTGRRILQRPPYEVAMERLLKRARARDVVVEVNGSPHRLDLKPEHARLAMQVGARVVLSCDAHNVEELEHLRYAVATARKGWVIRDRVVNTLDTVDFLKALRQAS
jgi:DNA polymerase (family 10)